MKKKIIPAFLPALSKLLILFLLFLCFIVGAYGQTVSGKVSDASGKGLSAVTVAVKGSSVGTSTDAAGITKQALGLGYSAAGIFIRRLTYPTSEIAVNTTNVNAAITKQGPDKLTTGIWWDKL